MSARLTDLERADRAMTGSQLQVLVTGLAEVYGWEWCHWRPLRNRRGIWQVPVEGPLGTGFPDLLLIRTRDRRVIFAELKGQLEVVRPAQVEVLERLRMLTGDAGPIALRALGAPQVDVHLWRPSDFREPVEQSNIGRALR